MLVASEISAMHYSSNVSCAFADHKTPTVPLIYLSAKLNLYIGILLWVMGDV